VRWRHLVRQQGRNDPASRPGRKSHRLYAVSDVADARLATTFNGGSPFGWPHETIAEFVITAEKYMFGIAV